MICNIVTGDITSRDNPADIIIGMNSELSDVTGIGLPFVKDAIPTRLIQLGSVITFDFDGDRRLHMIICHHLGQGGWDGAERHVRFGLDYLDHLEQMHNERDRQYSIVQIGTGRVGMRDGADHTAIHLAMAQSHLELELFVFKPLQVANADVIAAPLRPMSAWSPIHGENEVRALAA